MKNIFSRNSYLLGLFALLIISPSYGQFKEKNTDPTAELSYVENSKKASHYYLLESYRMALQLYLQLHKSNPEDLIINYRTGICYLNTTNKSKAIYYLEKSKLLDTKSTHTDIHYFLAQAYQAHHEFDKAIANYSNYKKTLNPKHEFDVEMSNEVDRIIEQCNYGKKLVAAPVKVTIEHMSSKINSPYSEKNPLISYDGNTIYFSSGRPLTTGGELDPKTDQYFDDIYYSTKSKDGWSSAKQIKGRVNTKGNDAPLSISSNGKRLYVCSQKNENGNIFYTDLGDTCWLPSKEMDKSINAFDYETGASISSDGKTFYFSSEQESGYGGDDLYKCELKADNTWGLAENLGPTINSSYDENDPYILPDNKTLYFSSQGHNSMGGYDIFVSKLNEKEKGWNTPTNLGYPINSAEDEISISWSGDGKTAYYSEINENGFGNEDIYMLHLGSAPKIDTAAKPVAKAKEVIPISIAKDVALPISTKLPQKGEILKDQVHFAFNESHTLTDYSKTKITNVIALLKRYPLLIIEIEGFADNTANVEYNMQISKIRATVVHDYMIQKGIDKSRLVVKIYKENVEASRVAKVQENIRNRRVEFKIISNTGLVSNEK